MPVFRPDPIRAFILYLSGLVFYVVVLAGFMLAASLPDFTIPFLLWLGAIFLLFFLLIAVYRKLLNWLWRRFLPGTMQVGQNWESDPDGVIRQLHTQVEALRGPHRWLEYVRTLVFADKDRYTFCERTLLQIAYLYTLRGDLQAARDTYQTCLDAYPRNDAAGEELNFIRTCSEQPPIRVAYLRSVRKANDLPVVVTLLKWGFVWVSVHQIFNSFYNPYIFGRTLAPDLFLDLLYDFSSPVTSILIVIIAILFFVIFELLLAGWRWIVSTIVHWNGHRGWNCMLQGRYAEAVPLFEEQLQFIRESHDLISALKWLMLTAAPDYTAEEQTLYNLARTFANLGDRESLLAHLDQFVALISQREHSLAAYYTIRRDGLRHLIEPQQSDPGQAEA